jgi:hypothetical protein
LTRKGEIIFINKFFETEKVTIGLNFVDITSSRSKLFGLSEDNILYEIDL